MSFPQTPPIALDAGTISVNHPELQAKTMDRACVLLATSLLDAIAENDSEGVSRLLRAGADPRIAGVFLDGEACPARPSKKHPAFTMVSPLAFAIATFRLEMLRPMLSEMKGLPFVAHDRSADIRQAALLHPSPDFYWKAADHLTWDDVIVYARQNVTAASLPQLALEVNNQFMSDTAGGNVKGLEFGWENLQAVLDASRMGASERNAEIWRLCWRSLTSCSREIDHQFIPREIRWVAEMLEQGASPLGDAAQRGREWADIFGTVMRGRCATDMGVFDHLAFTLGEFFRELPNADAKGLAHVWKGSFIERHFVDEDTPRSYRISTIWSLMRWGKELDEGEQVNRVLKHALSDGLPPDSVFSGYPLLHLAAGFDEPKWVETLLEAGATLDLPRLVPLPGDEDPEETTALDVARRFGAKEAEYVLMAARSRKAIADAIGRFREELGTAQMASAG